MSELRKMFRENGVDCTNPEKLLRLLDFKIETPVRIGGAELVGRIAIGAFTYLHDGFLHNVRIGRYCSIGRQLVCLQPNHPTNTISTHPFQYNELRHIISIEALAAAGFDQNEVTLIQRKQSKSPVTAIGNDVWIGSNVTLLNGIQVGDGAVIGAGAVITKDVPPYAVVVGNPGRLIRYRLDRTLIESLLQLQWWAYDLADFGRLRFDEPIAFLSEFERLLKDGALKRWTPKVLKKSDCDSWVG